MTMTPGLRKFVFAVHLTFSIGWIGAVVAYLALGASAVTSQDAQTVRAAWIAMEVTGWWAIVPLALAALLTGLSTVVLLLHMPSVSHAASLARAGDGADLGRLGGDLAHPAVGLLVLLA